MLRRLIALALIVTGLLALAAPAQARPEFSARVSPLDASTRHLMVGRSWRPGCPVPLRDLRLIRMKIWGFDRRWHRGSLVVNRRYTDEMVRVFKRLYEVRYPIRQMRLVDHFGADDHRSMAADNTSAFNCRYRAGICCTWSQHAYGRALDLNPVENPYVYAGGFSPANGRPFLDRSQHRRGMIHRHDAVWWAFHAVGWSWGGDWSGEKDYQHFSANGR
ncbi:MAG TPA: M15 family metallopeptidase [Actinomycetota bacterium]|nr:M15 family metallopeptidase [Actinomycetota bacterium]